MSESESERRRRWINFGELIAVLALIVSAAGVWVSWKSNSSGGDKPATVVEERGSVPLVLRGKSAEDGRALDISPVDPGHALESLVVAIDGASPIDAGSEGRLQASDVQSALSGHDKEVKDKTYSVPVKVTARYVEDGADRQGGGRYTLRYRWEGGGLFGGRSLRLVSLSR